MKIKKEILLNLLRKIYGGISKNTLKKNIIYSNVLIKINKNKIFCISSDSEMEIIAYDDINIIDDIEILIPFKKILDICKIAEKNSIITININDKNNKIEIFVNNNKISFQKITDIYPLISRKKNIEKQINLNTLILKDIFKKSIISIGENDPRVYLNGILTEINDNKLKMYSCDNHRMSIINISLNKKYENSKIIIPKKTAKEIIDIFPDNEIINILYTKNYIRFIVKNILLTSKLINFNYPNINDIIKAKGEKRFLINKDILRKAILYSNIVKNDKNKKNKIILTKNNMKILSSNTIEESISNIKINYSYDNMEIGVNLKYILDVLNVIETTNIYMTFSNPIAPIFIEEENSNNYFIIMPLNI